jgi:hypothetical protein
MAEAVFGLIGVVVGGLLAGGAEYVMQRRRERRDARAAARLLAEQLRRAIAFIHSELRPVASDWASGAFGDVEMEVWHHNRGILASALETAEWEGIAEAFEVVDALKKERWPREKQEEAIESIDTGLRALGRVAGSEQFWWAQRFRPDE